MNLEQAQYKIQRDLTNHPPDAKTQEDMEAVRASYHLVVNKLASVCEGDSRELSLALTNLEQSLMWAIAHLARTAFDMQLIEG